MKQEFNLVAELREDQGKGASRRLRRQGKVPAIIYGGGRPPRHLSGGQAPVQKSQFAPALQHDGKRNPPGRAIGGRNHYW